MIVINKKRIKIVLGCVIIGFFAFSVQIAKPKNMKKENSIETVATPISGKTIVVDARTSVSLMKGFAYCIKQKILSNYSFIKNNCRCKSL